MITGEQIVAFRKATKHSRKQMSEATGLTESKIANLEKGRPFKDQEADALYRLIGPWLEAGGGGDSSPPPPATSEEAGNPSPASNDVIIEPDEDDLETWTQLTTDNVVDTTQFRPPNTLEEGFVEDGLRRISNGELRTFKRCRRKWWLAYYRRLGLKLEERVGVRAVGSRIHLALAAWYVPEGTAQVSPFDVLEQSIKEDMEALADDAIALEQLVKEADLCRAMLEGYFEWLAETGADQGIIIMASETKLEVDPQIPGVRLIAKLDVRARREIDGARLFLDHKTVGSVTEPVRMLHMDEQMLHYHLCEFLDLLASGHQDERTDGAIYNMLRKVKRTPRATPPFYDRVEVRHNIDTLRSYWMRVKGTIDEIVELERKLKDGHDHREVAYPTPTRDCTWDCDFFHLCSMLDDGSRAEDYIAGNLITVNPLKRYETTDREVTHG